MHRSSARRHAWTLLLAAACQPEVALDGAATDVGEAGATEPGTTASSDEGSSADLPMPDDTSTDPPADLGGGSPDPLGRSRLVLDVVGEQGHHLELHEFVDGIAQPHVQLLPGAPANVELEVEALGPADRVVVTVRYSDGDHEVFLVDWSAGHPATVTALASGYESSATAWVESLDALVIRSDQDYVRVVLGQVPPEPVALFSDVQFGVSFEQSEILLMPVTPILVASGSMDGENLYVADVADPSRPTERVTDFADTGSYAREVRQLAGGHLLFRVDSHLGAPSGLRVLLREPGGWGETLQVPSPARPEADLYPALAGPPPDAFTYLAALPDDPALGVLLLGRVTGGVLAAPVALHPEQLGQVDLSSDGQRMVLASGPSRRIHVIDFVDGEPTMARVVAGPGDMGDATARLLQISADAEHAFLRLYDQDGGFGVRGFARVGLDADGSYEVVFERARSTDDVRNGVVAPDGRSLAFTHSSSDGFVTVLVDGAGATVGPLVVVDQGDAPIIDALHPSHDSAWLAVDGSSGGYTDSISVVRRDDPGTAVLRVDGLRGPSVWLP